MCRRRFRLHIRPVKNQERKKRMQLSLIVSIPRDHMHFDRVPEHETHEPSLPVSFPLSVFKNLKTSSSDQLGTEKITNVISSSILGNCLPVTTYFVQYASPGCN